MEVTEAGETGRGLFLTKAVKAGDLIMSAKVFAYSYVDEDLRPKVEITDLISPDYSSCSGMLCYRSDRTSW